MEIAFTVWLIHVLDVLGFASTLAALVFSIVLSAMITLKGEYTLQQTKAVGIAALMSLLCAVVIPPERTSWLMVGGYVTQNMLQSSVGDKLKKIVEQKLDQILAKNTSH